MSVLSDEMIQEVYEAAVNTRLDRAALLSGIQSSVQFGLTAAPSKGAQLLVDVRELNDLAWLPDGAIPLRTWLRNAELLSRPRREAEVFRRALAAVAAFMLDAGDALHRVAAREDADGGPAKILFLSANPVDKPRLELEREVREVRQRLRASAFRSELHLVPEWGALVAEIQQHLLEHRPQVVHFSGHGTKAGELIFEGDAGKSRPVPAAALVNLFGLVRDHVRCVVLNACFSEPQAEGIAQHVDCVIGMSAAMMNDAAVAFSGAFYQALGYGKSVKAAFEFGRSQIELSGLPQAEVPRLIVRRGVRAEDVRITQSGARAR